MIKSQKREGKLKADVGVRKMQGPCPYAASSAFGIDDEIFCYVFHDASYFPSFSGHRRPL